MMRVVFLAIAILYLQPSPASIVALVNEFLMLGRDYADCYCRLVTHFGLDHGRPPGESDLRT
jgi:hypothetical protein